MSSNRNPLRTPAQPLTIDDQRDETTAAPWAYVVFRDSFMSGWGAAAGRSFFVLEVSNPEEERAVIQAGENRSEMRFVDIIQARDSEHLAEKMGARRGDHISIRDREDCSRWYPGGDLFADI